MHPWHPWHACREGAGGPRAALFPSRHSLRGATSGRRSQSNASLHACCEGTRGPHAALLPSRHSLRGATSGHRSQNNASLHACHDVTGSLRGHLPACSKGSPCVAFWVTNPKNLF